MAESYSYIDFNGDGHEDMRQPVVLVTLRYRRPDGEWSHPIKPLAVVDTASSICTAPPEMAEQLGFVQPLVGPRRRIETGAGAVDYWMAEVELTIEGQSQTHRADIGFGGTRRNMHLGYLKVLEYFNAEFRPYRDTFSLEYVPPRLAE